MHMSAGTRTANGGRVSSSGMGRARCKYLGTVPSSAWTDPQVAGPLHAALHRACQQEVPQPTVALAIPSKHTLVATEKAMLSLHSHLHNCAVQTQAPTQAAIPNTPW